MLGAGAFRVGFAEATPVSGAMTAYYDSWISRGCHGTMTYLERQATLRRDPANVLPGVKTVICCAFPYAPQSGAPHPYIADYALGRDYHTVVRERLAPVTDHILHRYGAISRICTDSAPLHERYWAVRAGLGFVAKNHHLYIPGHGAGFILAEILTTLEMAPDSPLEQTCMRCGACARACPGGALLPDGALDARRCLSYLTTEARRSVPGRIIGCDICRQVCPMDKQVPPPLSDFEPSDEIAALTPDTLAAMTKNQRRRLLKNTALSRLR